MLAAATTQPELCYTPQVTSSTTKDHLRIWENGCIRNQYEFGPRCEMDITHSLLLFSSSLADNKSFIISHRHACSSQHVPSDTQPCPASGSDRPTERVSEVNEFESESPKLHQSVQRPRARSIPGQPEPAHPRIGSDVRAPPDDESRQRKLQHR